MAHFRYILHTLALALLAAAATANAQPTYGLDFVTVGAPGNRGTLPHEVPWNQSWTVGLGAVDYEYRIMRTKVTGADYFEFVQAYAPYWPDDPRDPRLIGRWINATPGSGGTWNFSQIPGTQGFGAAMDWEMAARYCNWLHNGKVNEQWAFESGAYDTSTFVWGPNGWEHQIKRSPEARFWIPSLDEMVKAAYYDPNRYGPGEEGYWRYPNSSDDPLVMGWPGEGGETIGELRPGGPNWLGSGAWDLGQYPHVQSPWGLLDVSGSVADYTEEVYNAPGLIRATGSWAGGMHRPFDRLDFLNIASLHEGSAGLRIATVIPSPGISSVGVFILASLSRRQRRERSRPVKPRMPQENHQLHPTICMA